MIDTILGELSHFPSAFLAFLRSFRAPCPPVAAAASARATRADTSSKSGTAASGGRTPSDCLTITFSVALPIRARADAAARARINSAMLSSTRNPEDSMFVIRVFDPARSCTKNGFACDAAFCASDRGNSRLNRLSSRRSFNMCGT